MSKTVLISHRVIFTSQFRWAAVWDWSLVGGRPSGVVGREKDIRNGSLHPITEAVRIFSYKAGGAFGGGS